MKILIFSLNYSPEKTGIGKYNGEMAVWLKGQGHDVRVIAAPPYYPMWSVERGYSSKRYKQELLDDIVVFRSPLWVPKSPSGLKRIFHLLSFSLSSIPILIASRRWSPDAVFLTEPPLICAPAVLLFSRICGAKCWLHIQDFEVDAAFGLGLLRVGALKKFAYRFEQFLMSKFDRVSSISTKMIELVVSKGVHRSKVVFFPNWVNLNKITPIKVSPYRIELGLKADSFVVLYSGNMGNKQGLEILGELAHSLSRRSDVFFVFCGNGSGRTSLEESCEGLHNVMFLDLQPEERLSDFLGLADVHILPQRADAADLVMPSKLTGMLASGRPIIITAHADTELGHVAQQCGLLAEPGDVLGISRLIEELLVDKDRCRSLGAYARSYAEKYIDRESVLATFNEELLSLVRPEKFVAS